MAVTFGRDDQIRRVTPAVMHASAMALPWAISIAAEACSQTGLVKLALKREGKGLCYSLLQRRPRKNWQLRALRRLGRSGLLG